MTSIVLGRGVDPMTAILFRAARSIVMSGQIDVSCENILVRRGIETTAKICKQVWVYGCTYTGKVRYIDITLHINVYGYKVVGNRLSTLAHLLARESSAGSILLDL